MNMKKLLFVLLALMLAFVSCEKAPSADNEGMTEVEKKVFTVTPRQFSWRHYMVQYCPKSVTFNVESNASWYCYIEGGFAGGKLSKTEGVGNGGVTYSFDALDRVGRKESATLYFVWTDENNKTHKVSCSLYREYANYEDFV